MTPATATKSEITSEDMIYAKRFFEFRNRFVDQNQRDAAAKLGISQPYISQIESGKKRIGFTLVDTLIRNFGLNAEWWITGEGKPNKKFEAPKGELLTSVKDLQGEIDILKRHILILEKNQAAFINMLSKKIESIDKIEDFISNNKKNG